MHLREGTLGDLPFVADIATEALWDDEIVQFLAPYRAQYPLSHRDNELHRAKRRFFSGNRLIVAVTDENDVTWSGKETIAGFAFWSDTRDTSKPPMLPSSMLGNGRFTNMAMVWRTKLLTWCRLRAGRPQTRSVLQVVLWYRQVL